MEGLLTTIVGACAAGAAAGFAVGFYVSRECDSRTFAELKQAKKLLEDIMNWFVYPLKNYSLTDDDKKHINNAENFLKYGLKKR